MATVLIVPVFGSLKSLLTGGPQGAGTRSRNLSLIQMGGEGKEEKLGRGTPPRLLSPHPVSHLFWTCVPMPRPPKLAVGTFTPEPHLCSSTT